MPSPRETDFIENPMPPAPPPPTPHVGGPVPSPDAEAEALAAELTDEPTITQSE
ncbi:MAG TPA: hypothetical protein VEO54_00755 [Thermoanaerobaculia bacterium]|nr:hypothetical protein [Thermoanaerobaculia bacterium]